MDARLQVVSLSRSATDEEVKNTATALNAAIGASNRGINANFQFSFFVHFLVCSVRALSLCFCLSVSLSLCLSLCVSSRVSSLSLSLLSLSSLSLFSLCLCLSVSFSLFFPSSDLPPS